MLYTLLHAWLTGFLVYAECIFWIDPDPFAEYVGHRGYLEIKVQKAIVITVIMCILYLFVFILYVRRFKIQHWISLAVCGVGLLLVIAVPRILRDNLPHSRVYPITYTAADYTAFLVQDLKG